MPAEAAKPPPALAIPALESWEPNRAEPEPAYPRPAFWTALGRGARNRCPVCGQGRVFSSYLGLVPECEVCATPLGRLRPDDAAPYFVILLAGHVLLPPVFWVERAFEPPMWVHMALWLPLFTIACTLLLRPVKGAVVGLLCRLGFTGDEHLPQPPPASPGA